jgi:hypothetical protein
MMERFDAMKKQLSELATVLNEFKSEAVQLRVLELVFGERSTEGAPSHKGDEKTPARFGAQTTSRAKKKDAVATGKRKKAPAGTGAPATLTQLLSGNFFDEARTINDIIEHCKNNLARTFKANEFSGKLGRMVRSDELTRKKNADNQYEYKKP